jgi:glucose-6-phosphate isomerase
MNYTKLQWWDRFQKYHTAFPSVGLALDLSRMNVDDAFFAAMEPRIEKAFTFMAALEKGAIANPDENRMVGHYWLRNPALAPTPEIAGEITAAIAKIKDMATKIHAGTIMGAEGTFKNYLLIGIGGSALGPQFVAHALGNPSTDFLKPHFFDNTDPDGMQRVITTLGNDLSRTLCIVVSKSGGTKETRNGMLVAQAAYENAGLHFGKHCLAITTDSSELDKFAIKNEFIDSFPMWDWVGGRTSVLSAVGLLPAALQGLDIDGMLTGAKAIDEITRSTDYKFNPAALLALAWYASGNGKGLKNMVVLPYKDRLELFSKYLQQLVMESLGKALDLDKNVVHQGITVLGNKGATDQHSYIQQLRDGLNDFFATFIEVLHDQDSVALEVEPNTTSGDFLHGFFMGTRQALAESDRESITLTIDKVSPFSVGLLIALFERAVGFYATLVNINAYHQPGVEAGKKAAGNIIEIQRLLLKYLEANQLKGFTAAELATAIGKPEDVESVYKVARHLSANGCEVEFVRGPNLAENKFGIFE